MRIGRKVAVWGTFDVVHQGHLQFLESAGRYSASLSVILLPDKHVGQNKGIAPVYSSLLRERALLKTGLVDQVVEDCMSDGLASLDLIKPDLFCLGYDQVTVWEELLRYYLSTRFPKCTLVTLPVFAGGVHSRQLRHQISLPVLSW